MNKPSANTQHAYNTALVHLRETRKVQVVRTEQGQYFLPLDIQFAQMLKDSLEEIYGKHISTAGKAYLKLVKA